MSNIQRLIINELTAESWLLEATSETLLGLIASLPESQITSSAHGVQLGTQSKNLLNIRNKNQISFCQQGINLKLPIYRTHISSNINQEKDITLGIDLHHHQESLTISFDLNPSTQQIFNQFASLIKSTISTQELLESINLDSKNACPCCKQKKLAIRENESIHPLHHILQYLAIQSLPTTFTLHGNSISAHREFAPTSVQTHRGITYLKNETDHFIVDLTEVYTIRIEVSHAKPKPTTNLYLYNSLGNTISTISQLGATQYSTWNHISNLAKAPC